MNPKIEEPGSSGTVSSEDGDHDYNLPLYRKRGEEFEASNPDDNTQRLGRAAIRAAMKDFDNTMASNPDRPERQRRDPFNMGANPAEEARAVMDRAKERAEARAKQSESVQEEGLNSTTQDNLDAEGGEAPEAPEMQEQQEQSIETVAEKEPEVLEISEQEEAPIVPIKPELLTELNNRGIKVEMVESFGNLAMYNESKKTLKIRYDADAEFVDEYIHNTILAEDDAGDGQENSIEGGERGEEQREEESAEDSEEVVEDKKEDESDEPEALKEILDIGQGDLNGIKIDASSFFTNGPLIKESREAITHVLGEIDGGVLELERIDQELLSKSGLKVEIGINHYTTPAYNKESNSVTVSVGEDAISFKNFLTHEVLPHLHAGESKSVVKIDQVVPPEIKPATENVQNEAAQENTVDKLVKKAKEKGVKIVFTDKFLSKEGDQEEKDKQILASRVIELLDYLSPEELGQLIKETEERPLEIGHEIRDEFDIEDLVSSVRRKVQKVQIESSYSEDGKDIKPEIDAEPGQELEKPKDSNLDKSDGSTKEDGEEEKEKTPEENKKEEPKETVEVITTLDDLKDARRAMAKAEYEAAKNKTEFDENSPAYKEYIKQKNEAALYMKKLLRAKLGGGGPLTKEQEEKLERDLNYMVYKDLVEAENEAYNKAKEEFKESEKKSWLRTKAEGLLHSKGVEWYRGLSKVQRVGLNVLLFGTAVGIGTFAVGGAASAAVGATLYRGARALNSLAGAEIGRRIGEKGVGKKIMKAEDIDKWEAEEKEKLLNSQGSIEEKDKAYKKIKEKAAKEKKKLAIYKAAMTVGLGGAAGIGSGLVLDSYYGGAPRGAYDPSKSSGTGPKPSPVPESPKPPTTPPAPPPAPSVEAGIKSIFANPEVVKHSVEGGDSNWNLLKETLNNYDKFKNLSGGNAANASEVLAAKKTYIISALNNEVLKNPSTYGVGNEGALNIGDKVDYTELFKDKAKIDKIFESAENLKPHQVENIVKNNAAISQWVEENPGKPLNEDTVKEILSHKADPSDGYVEKGGEQEIDGDKSAVNPENPVPGEEVNEEPAREPAQRPREYLGDESPSEEYTLYAAAPLAGAAVVKNKLENKDNKAKDLEEEIEAAKRRLGELSKDNVVEMPRREGLRSMQFDTETERHVRESVGELLDNVYGKKGMLGIGRVVGSESDEWQKEMKNLQIKKVLRFYGKNSAEPLFSPQTAKILNSKKSHKNLIDVIRYINEEEANNAIVPESDSETVEDFVRRLAAFVYKKTVAENQSGSSAGLAKAA